MAGGDGRSASDGLNSSATMMFGHVETLEDRIEHLERVQAQQDATEGFTAFHCLDPFNPKIPVSRPRPLALMSCACRQPEHIYLDNIPNIQSSWVTQNTKSGRWL